MRRKIINIDTDENKKEVFEKFNSVNSKHQAHILFGISDNRSGSEYLKEIAQEIGFDLNVYKQRKEKSKRYCLQCGKEINKGKFCSNKCSTEYRKNIILQKWLKNEYIINGNCPLTKTIKEFLLKKNNYKCEECGFEGYNRKTGNTILQFHHKDGDSSNNSPENIQVLCPNCHAMTENYMALNKGHSARDKRFHL